MSKGQLINLLMKHCIYELPSMHTRQYNLLSQIMRMAICRASDRVRKKMTNYAEIYRNIMRKKVLIMRKTCWIMRKIFRSLRSPKITSFHAAEIELPPKPRVCSQANFKQKNYISIWAFPVIFICIWYVMKLSYQLICDSMKITQPLFCWLKLIFLLCISNTIQT